MLRAFVLVAALALAGCASSLPPPAYADFAPRAAPTLVTSAKVPEADVLVESFYVSGPSEELDKKVAEQIAKHPEQSGLHEIAGYRAVLAGDPHAAFEHFRLAAADTNAIAPELYAWEMGTLASRVSEHLEARALFDLLARTHPRPQVANIAAFELARIDRSIGDRDGAEKATLGLGFVPSFRVIGVFDNDQNKGFAFPYAPERDHTREKTRGMLLDVSWRTIEVDAGDGLVPLADVLFPRDAAIAYLETFVEAPSAREAELRVTTSGSLRAWVNDRLVISDERDGGGALDGSVARISLSRGLNRVLLKSAHRSGPWRLGARVTTTDGAAMRDLRFAVEAGGAPVGIGAEARPPPRGASAPFAGASNARRRFLKARAFLRSGLRKSAVVELDSMLAANDDSALATYYAALAHWDDGETGKALDLLSHGVKSFATSPGFLVKRGRFYAQRKLYDKAQRDLRLALEKSPGASDAAFELASVYASRGWHVDRCALVQKAIDRTPDLTGGWLELGKCREDQSLARAAELAYERAHALMPGSPSALDHLVSLAERRLDFDAATRLQALRRAASPTSFDALLDEADLYRRAGDAVHERAALERARIQNPDAPRPCELLGDLQLGQGKTEEAEKSYRLALERDPDDFALAERIESLSKSGPTVAERIAPTQEDIDRAIRRADSLVPHPGSHYAVLLRDEVATVNADGSTKRLVTLVSVALDTDGRDALIQAALPARGRTKVVDAYSIRKGGDRQEASSITPQSIRFRSLDVGSIVVIQYVAYAPESRFLPNELAATWFAQEVNAEVVHARWALVFASERKQIHVEVRGAIQQRTDRIDGLEVRTFTADKLAPALPEPSMVPFSDTLAMAAISTVPSWDDYVRFERALLTDVFASTRDLDELAARLTKDETTQAGKLKRIWDYAAEQIRYQQEYEDTIAGVRPHAAAVVIERGYGDCKDKAVLVIRLARSVGIDVQYALLRTTSAGKMLRDIPNQQFNHAIAYVPKQTGIDSAFFLDATTNGLDIGNLRGDDQGATSLVLDTMTGRWNLVDIPYASPETESTKHAVTVDIKSPRKAKAHDEIEVRGGFAASLRKALRSKEGARKAYQGISELLFPGTTLEDGSADHDQDLMRPLAVKLDVDVTNTLKEADGKLRMNVPLPFPLASKVTLTTRTTPLALQMGVVDLEMTITPPDGYGLARAPGDLAVDHACFSIERKTLQEGGKVVLSTHYTGKCPVIETKDYPYFRTQVQRVIAESQEEITFEPKPKWRR